MELLDGWVKVEGKTSGQTYHRREVSFDQWCVLHDNGVWKCSPPVPDPRTSRDCPTFGDPLSAMCWVELEVANGN